MSKFSVTWKIDSEEQNPVEAARDALRNQRHVASTEGRFEVTNVATGKATKVDLYDVGHASRRVRSPKFLVTWEIDSEQKTPVKAALEALLIQRYTDSTATHFRVTNVATGEVTDVDLHEVDYDAVPAP